MHVPQALALVQAGAAGPKAHRAFVAEVLDLGPWMWPPVASKSFPTAVRIADRDSPPAPGVGELLVVSTNPTRAALWVLRSSGEPGRVGLASDAEISWRTASHAVTRSLPVLASGMRNLARSPPSAAFVGAVLESNSMELQDEVLVGPSFGLAFVLSMASRALGAEIPERWSASAEVDGLGGLRPVGDIARKISAFGACRSRETTLLVARGQRDLPDIIPPHVSVLEVASAAEALDLVFPDAPATFVARAGVTNTSRAVLARSLLALVLEGRRALIEWGAVHRAATLALANWENLPEDVMETLTFVRAVALRHDGEGAPAALPGDAWLRRAPLSLRVEVIAHLVQQCHDVGTPSFEEVRSLARPCLEVTDADAFEPHLKVKGAWGRLIGLRGSMHEALERLEAVAHGFTRRLTMQEVSFSLAGWYRFAGSTRDVEAFARAESFRSDAELHAGLDDEGWAHVELARARAGILAGVGGATTWATALQSLALAPARRDVPAALRSDVPIHVAMSAARWCVRNLPEGDPSKDAARKLIRRAASRPARESTTALRVAGLLNGLLLGLDEAVASRDATAVASLVDELTRHRPGLLGHLLGWAPDDPLERGRFVALNYPY